MNKDELIATAQARSDQVDADDLIGGITLDVTIKTVQRGPSNEQPLQLVLEETEKFYRPSKTYRRALIGCFGDEPSNWVGKRLRLVRNPDTMFGGVKVGGIEVSHASIEAPVMLMLAAKRGKKTAVKIDVMPAATNQAPKATVAATVAPVAAPDTVNLPAFDYDAAIDAMRAAESEEQLKAAYVLAAKRAKADGEEDTLAVLTKVKDECKAALPAQKPVASKPAPKPHAKDTISGDPNEGNLDDVPAFRKPAGDRGRDLI